MQILTKKNINILTRIFAINNVVLAVFLLVKIFMCLECTVIYFLESNGYIILLYTLNELLSSIISRYVSKKIGDYTEELQNENKELKKRQGY